mgnify:CR=1 FL=1
MKNVDLMTCVSELEQENIVKKTTVISTSINEEIIKAMNEISTIENKDQKVKIQEPDKIVTNAEKVIYYSISYL